MSLNDHDVLRSDLRFEDFTAATVWDTISALDAEGGGTRWASEDPTSGRPGTCCVCLGSKPCTYASFVSSGLLRCTAPASRSPGVVYLQVSASPGHWVDDPAAYGCVNVPM